jgi:hypothetical protein
MKFATERPFPNPGLSRVDATRSCCGHATVIKRMSDCVVRLYVAEAPNPGSAKPFRPRMKSFWSGWAVNPKRIARQDRGHWSNWRVRSCGQSSVQFIGHIATPACWRCDGITTTPATREEADRTSGFGIARFFESQMRELWPAGPMVGSPSRRDANGPPCCCPAGWGFRSLRPNAVKHGALGSGRFIALGDGGAAPGLPGGKQEGNAGVALGIHWTALVAALWHGPCAWPAAAVGTTPSGNSGEHVQ